MSTENQNPVSVEVPASGTLEVKNKMAALKKLGVDTISLGAGELKFEKAKHIFQSEAYLTRTKASSGYTAAPGLLQLRQAIAYKDKRDYGITTNPDTDIYVSPGGKGALVALMWTTFGNPSNPNFDGRDEVVVPTPYWLSHDPILEYTGGKMVNVPCPASQDYKITPDQLRAAITENTKFVMLTSPHNPGGTAYTEEEYQALADVIREYPDIYVVTEDMYEHYMYDGRERTHFSKTAPDLQDRTIRVNCFSKSDELAGERVGWLSGPAAIVTPVKKFASHIFGNAPISGQWKGVSAILGHRMLKLAYKQPEKFAAELANGRADADFDAVSALRNKKISILEAWRDAVLSEFEKTDLITPRPEGSFYAFPSIENYIGRQFPDDLTLVDGLDDKKLQTLGMSSFAGKTITSAKDFADAAMIHAGVGVVPGEDFEAASSFRIAYVESRATEAAQRLSGLLKKITP